MGTLTVTTAPTELPVTMSEVKAWLRETDANQDPEIASALRSAMDILDGPNGLLNRALCTQTLQYTMDLFPSYGWWGYGYFRSAFELPLSPVQSVSSITYLDENGASQTLASSGYRVLNTGAETRRCRVELAYGESWPTTREIEQAVTVTYVAGFGARNAVPEKYRQLILAMVKEIYDHRDPMDVLNRNPAFNGLFTQCQFPGHA